MARDSDAGARGKAGAGNRNHLLDPNRSSVRRVAPRRSVAPRASLPANAPRTSHPANAPRASLPSGAPRSSLPASAPRADVPGIPRNRRLPATQKRERSGAGLLKRMRLGLVSGLVAGAQGAVARARSLGARLRGPSSAILTLLGLCIVLSTAVFLGRFVQRHLTTSPAFAISAIDVKGLDRVERAELLEAAGLDLGTNVFARGPEDVRARLLRHPWILGAHVERKLPSRFEIAVRERKPVALLVVEACGRPAPRDADPLLDEASCDEPSSIYLVSEDARMFKRLSGKDPVDLPVITGVTRQRVASDPQLSRRVLDRSVALMREYAESGLAKSHAIGEIHLEDNEGISLYVGADLTYVRLGSPPFTEKFRRLSKVFERLAKEQARAEYVYLDNEQRPDRVAVRLR